MNLIKFLEKVPKGRIQLSDFELIPYRFSNSFTSGKRIEHDLTGLCFYVNPIDAVNEASNKEGDTYLYRSGSITYDFNYLIGTAIALLYGDSWWKGFCKKTKILFNARCYPITRRIHFQLNTDFGLVVWSFIKRKRSKKKNV